MKLNGIESIALGECVWRRSVLCFAKSSTAIDEEIEFRIKGQGGNTVRLVLLPTSYPCSYWQKWLGDGASTWWYQRRRSSSCASSSQSSNEFLNDGSNQSRLEVDETLACGCQTLQIKAN